MVQSDHYMALIGVIICVFIIFIVREHQYNSIHRNLINGYWDASQAFCLRSDIKSAQALFRDDKVYLLIDDGDGVKLNKCVDINLSPSWWSGNNSSKWSIEFSEPVDPLPQHCELRLDAERIMMGLFKDNTLYMELFRDNKASAGVI